MDEVQGRIQGGIGEGFSPFGNFFSVLWFFKKKIPKPPLNFPVHTKKFQNPSLEKFLDTPLMRYHQ